MKLRDQKGIVVTLGARVGGGGEADIFAVDGKPDKVAKIYLAHAVDRIEKLQVMVQHPPADPTQHQGHVSICWPVSLLFNLSNKGVGFLMPRLDWSKHRELFKLYNPRDRVKEAPYFTWTYLLKAAENIAIVLDSVHARGYVIGDVNESNFFVSDQALVTLIDCDSMQVRTPGKVFRCPVAKADYLAPELHGADLTKTDRRKEHDNFALAVLIFLLLMEGVHPYSGVWRLAGDPPDIGRRIASGDFAYAGSSRISPMPSAPPYNLLPATLKALFGRTFADGHKNPAARPTAKEWHRALADLSGNLDLCSVNTQHQYSRHLARCPWCERTRLLGGLDPFPGVLKQEPLKAQPFTGQKPVLVPVARVPTPAPPPPSQQALQQAPSAQSQPIRPQKLSFAFKVWFWGLWLLWSIPCLMIGSADGASESTVKDMWLLFLAGLFVSLFAAHHRAKIQQWTRTQRAKITRFDQGVIVFSIFVVGIALVAIRTTAPAPDSSTPPMQSITKQGAASTPASTEETDYANGIIREVDRNFVFFADKEHPNPRKGAAVDMSFQIGPTGYHNAASVIKSSGDSGVDWACTQAVDKSSNFGNLPASTKGGNIIVSYRCAFNAPDTVTRVVLVPVAPNTPKPVKAMLNREPAQAPDYDALAQKYGGKVSEAWDGTYTGTAHHNNSGLDADILVTIVKQDTAAINGYFSVKPPLYGSGPLTGASVVNDGIEFHVTSAPPMGFDLDFEGRHVSDGSVRGIYTVTNGQSGTFTMHKNSALRVPAATNPPSVFNYNDLVQNVLVRLDRSWEKTTVIPVPIGTHVTVRFFIMPSGTLEQSYVTNTSGYSSIDEQCLQAVKNTAFPPHAGYPGGLWESYTCTVASGQTTFKEEHAAPTHPTAVISPVSKAWLDYINVVDALIDQRWRKTAYAGQVSPGETAVRFTVLPNGLVGEPTVTVSSGSPAIDAACKAVVGDPIGWYAPRLPEGYNSPVFLAYVCK